MPSEKPDILTVHKANNKSSLLVIGVVNIVTLEGGSVVSFAFYFGRPPSRQQFEVEVKLPPKIARAPESS